MKTETLEYRLNGLNFRGRLAFDETKTGKRPGVLVVHEAWGLGEQMKQRAERLAQRGYVALAVDMVGDGEPFTSNEDALQGAGGLRNDPATLRPRIRAACDSLAAQPQVDPGRIAAIGPCIGGFIEEMTQAGADFQVIVYSHTKHSFTNPRAGERGMEALAYNPLTEQRSWSLMRSFFDEIFGAR